MPPIRPERKSDYIQITQINNAALGQLNEGKLVENLRKNKNFIPQLSLVAQMNEEIVGHILFAPIKIADGERRHQSIAPRRYRFIRPIKKRESAQR